MPKVSGRESSISRALAWSWSELASTDVRSVSIEICTVTTVEIAGERGPREKKNR